MDAMKANSKLTGLATRLANDALEIWIDDPSKFREFHKSLGHPPFVAEALIQRLSKPPAFPRMRRHKSALNQIKEIISKLPECRAMLRVVPLVIGPEPFLNAGACPVPHGGDFIMLNEGIFMAPSWVGAFQRALFRKDFDISDDEAIQIFSDLPHLSRAIMQGPEAYFSSPKPMQALVRNIELLGKEKDWTFHQVFPIVFVILHELGHIKLGHTTVIRDWPKPENLSKSLEYGLLSTRRRFEHEADGFAARTILELAKKLAINDGSVEMGIAFFFALVRTYEKQQAKIPLNLRTHPPATLRFHQAIKLVCSKKRLSGWKPHFLGLCQLCIFETRIDSKGVLWYGSR
jgi:hypothetical protein